MGKKTSAVVVVIAALGIAAGLIRTWAGAPVDRGVSAGSTASKAALSTGWEASAIQAAAREPNTTLPAQAPGPGIAPRVDWERDPGTLNSQIQLVLQSRNGVMAADLARKLRECGITARLMQPDMIQRQATATGDPGAQAVMSEQLRSYQRILANCQTVTDWRQAQLELLEIAMARQVIGAAVQSYHLGQRGPDVLEAVVRDAIAGDVSSLVPVTSHAPSAFAMAPDLQRSLRYAFEIAANDAEVGAFVRRYLDIAESASVPLAGEAQARFNHEGLTDAQRAQARATATQLIQRVKAPKDDVAGAD